MNIMKATLTSNHLSSNPISGMSPLCSSLPINAAAPSTNRVMTNRLNRGSTNEMRCRSSNNAVVIPNIQAASASTEMPSRKKR